MEGQKGHVHPISGGQTGLVGAAANIFRALCARLFLTYSFRYVVPPLPLFGATFTFLSFILANFVLNFSNFCCHGDRGRSEVNFCETDKLYDIDNPLIGATYLELYLTSAELWLISC